MEIPFEKSFASHENAKYWSDKNKLKASEVFKFSGKKGLFNCNECNHEFESIISNVANGQWCSYCKGDKLCTNLDCSMCFNKSMASYEQSNYWSPLNLISPRLVLKGTNTKYIFNCDKCSHEFKLIPNKIKSENAWCPYCANKLCNDDNCQICFNNSFASQPRAKYWSSLNTVRPRDVRISSIKRFLFDCNNCNHTVDIALNSIKHGAWCRYCCNNSVVLCTDTNCTHCFNKSFASHEMSKYWSPNNTVNPRDVFKKCDKKFLFICGDCKNEFITQPNSISLGRGCPYCKNKTETKLYKWLKTKCENIQYQPKYEWCRNPKTNRKLPFDFEYKNIIIELDGPHHFEQVSNWRTPEEQNFLDKHKMATALKNNKHVIRILQEYVYYDLSDWDKKLTETIQKLESIHEPTVMYIGVDPIYFEDLPHV